MTEVVYYVATSVDGYIATQGGGIEWLRPFETPGEDYGYAAFYASVDVLLMGRRTYELAKTFDVWPYAGKSAYVFTRRADGRAPADVTFTRLAPAALVSRLAVHGVKRAWLVGGGELAASFREARLVTEYVVSVIPVMLGSGIPFAGDRGPFERLACTGTRSYANGVVQSVYRHAR